MPSGSLTTAFLPAATESKAGNCLRRSIGALLDGAGSLNDYRLCASGRGVPSDLESHFLQRCAVALRRQLPGDGIVEVELQVITRGGHRVRDQAASEQRGAILQVSGPVSDFLAVSGELYFRDRTTY